MQIGSPTLNPGIVTISSVTAKIQDSAGNALTSTAGALDVNATIDTTGLATDTGQTTGNGFLGTIAGAISATHMQVDVISAPTTAVTGTFWQATQPVSLASVPSHNVTNAGTFAVQAAQSGTWNVGTVTAVTGITNALPAGTNAIGKLAANSGVDIGDVDVTSIAAGTNTIGAVNVKPTTSGGLDIFRSIDLDESEEEVKATAGQVFGWYIYNKAAAVTYVKFYNATAANTTVGTTTPVMTVPIPATAGANVEFTNGITFATAITVAATTGVADADTGAPAANDLIINLLYK